MSESDAWIRNASALAAWASEHLVNDVTRYALYRPAGDVVVYGQATPGVLSRHFTGEDTIGIHSRSRGAARWIAAALTGPSAAANFTAARGMYDDARAMGMRPLLEDAGESRINVWVILDAPTPVARAVAVASWLTRDCHHVKVDRHPAGADAWLRLPGRSDRSDHHSRIWDGAWREGQAAIDLILRTTGAPPPDDGDGYGPAWFRDRDRAEAIVADMYREHLFRMMTGYYSRRNSACDALDRIDPDVVRRDWIRVGLALKNEFGAGDGWILWLLWSAKGAKYDRDSIAETWASFRGGSANPVTLGTLFYLAGVNRGS